MNYESELFEIDKDKPSHLLFKLKFQQNEKQNIDPILELYRGKLYSCLLKYFTIDCINILGTNIFSIKKSYSRTIANLLSSWIFSLYTEYDFSSDYFFPTNYSNTTQLENTLLDLCKYDNNINNPIDKINKIITNLKINYDNQLKQLNNYQSSNFYLLNKNNYSIKKEKTHVKKNKHSDMETLFYKFTITFPFIIKDKRLQNILGNILISHKVYDKLCDNFISTPILQNKKDEIIWSIIFRYQLLGSNNHQLAVLPNIMNKMNTDFNLNFECFASAINNTMSNFCSIYWDLEKYFGSVGSFFNIIPIKGTYGFNPPYQKDIIELGIHKIFSYLNSSEELTFFITIPIWDTFGKNIMKQLFNNELEKQNIDYGDFNIIKEIKESLFFKKLRMIPKEEFTYVDHNFELYKNKTIQNTYIIILSNTNNDFSKIDDYNFNLE